MISSYLPIFFVFLLAAGFALCMLGLSHVLGPRIDDKVKLSAYESGVDPVAETHTRLNIRFFVVALAFIIFDIEIVFLFPWAIVFRNLVGASALILYEMVFFLAVLLFGYLYIWRKGVFEWE